MRLQSHGHVITPLMALVVLSVAVDGYRILLVYPFITRSISILGDGYARELLRKGHEVTYITSHPQKQHHDNLTQVDVSSIHDLGPSDYISIERLGTSKMNDVNEIISICVANSEAVLRHENVRALIHDTTKKFDAVIAVWVYSDLYAMFAGLYQCPLVWSTTMAADSLFLRLVDEMPNPAYTRDNCGYLSQPFSFRERAWGLWIQLEKLFVTESKMPSAEQLYRDVFESAARHRGVTLPSYQELIYNGSIALANSHPSLGDSSKMPHNVKEIAGYHIESVTKPLPSNLKEIMDNAKFGVIYFSLGSFMQSKYLPEEMRSSLLKMFAGLKQTVLWKFEEGLQNLPKNVHILQWAPQPSILAHPNTKLFITHGGLLSTTETVHFGIPVIGIPLFVDQFLNMERSVEKGYAVRVKFSVNLASDLKYAIDEVLGNTSYADRVKHVSSLYHDRPLAPADELVYWVEYAVRTRGAVHLRSPALLLPWYSRLYIDLLALLLATLLVIGLLVKLLLRRCRDQLLVRKQKLQ